MPFQDYSDVPGQNTTIGDSIFIGPNMERAKVRPSLQQLAADGRSLRDEMIAGIGELPSFIQSGAGAVVRPTQAKMREQVSVLDFADAGVDLTLGAISANTAFTRALASSDHVYVPPGEYLITGSGFTMGKGKRLSGVVGCEAGTQYATTGSRLKMDPAATRAITIAKGAYVSADSVMIEGIAFNGENNDYAIYGDEFRQSQFRNLRFYNFKKCIFASGKTWLNVYEDIKAFTFDRFFEGDNASEDSVMRQVVMRAYRPSSIGVLLNYHSQTFRFVGCDISECDAGVSLPISNANSTVMFDSCYFELASQSLTGAIIGATGAGSSLVISVRNCRFYDKSAFVDPFTPITSIAFNFSGTGATEIICDGSTFAEIDKIVKDGSGSAITLIHGRNNAISHSGSYAIYDNLTNAAKRLRLFGIANVDNLQAIDGSYFKVHDFTNPFVLAMPAVGTGIYDIDITPVNNPGAPNLVKYRYQPKGSFTNGVLTETQDTASLFTSGVSGDTITLTSSAAFSGQVAIRKIA